MNKRFLRKIFISEIFAKRKLTIWVEDLYASRKEAYPMDDASIIELFRERNECVNSAYYEIWNNIPPDDPNDFRSYLCRIMRNIAINRLKYNSAEKRNPQFTVSIDEIAEIVPSDDDQSVSDDVLADAFSRFLRSQDEKHRNVFIRRYWFGDSVSQIAELYGMKGKTVATYLFRTRKKLKAFLQKEGYDYE